MDAAHILLGRDMLEISLYFGPDVIVFIVFPRQLSD